MQRIQDRVPFSFVLVLFASSLFTLGSGAGTQELDGPNNEADVAALHQQDEDQAVEYWSHARQELFEGVELTGAQERQVDAIMNQAAADRALGRKYEVELREAKRSGDSERERDLHKKMKGVHSRNFPQNRIKAMGAVLASHQVEDFEVNRRLHVERQAERERKAKEGVQMHPYQHRRGGEQHAPGNHPRH